MDFGDWRVLGSRRDFLAASKGGEVLLWHMTLGCGVRSDISIAPSDQLWYTQGAFFCAAAAEPNQLYIVPLLRSVADLATALATPLPHRLPATLPFERAREVSRGQRFTVLRDRFDSAFLPPLLRLVDELYVLSDAASEGTADIERRN